MRTKNHNQINAKIDPVLHHRLEAHCKESKTDRSTVMRDALRKHLDFQSSGGDVADIKRDVGSIAKIVSDNTDQIERLIEAIDVMTKRGG